MVSLLCEFCGHSAMLTPPIYLKVPYIPEPHCVNTVLNGTLSCVDFMDVIMGDIPDLER